MATVSELERGQIGETLGLSEDVVTAMLSRTAGIESVDIEGVLFESGEVSDSLFIISADVKTPSFVNLTGSMNISGREVFIERVVEGCLGEFEFVGRDLQGRYLDRILTAKVAQKTRLVRVPFRIIASLDATDLVTVDRQLTQTGARRYADLVDRLVLNTTSDNVILLARSLLRLGEDVGVSEGGGRRVSLRLTQQDLANEVGLSREAVNAHLVEWERSMLVSMRPNEIRILDFERLKRMIDAGTMASREDLGRVLKSADRSLASGDHFRARNMLLDALRFYPNSVELKYRCFLACIRSGSELEATSFIEEFEPKSGGQSVPDLVESIRDGLRSPRKSGRKKRAEDLSGFADSEIEDHEDATEVERAISVRTPQLLEDLLSARGRLLKERAFSQASAPDNTALREALAAYEVAYDATGGVFAGVNASTLALLVGDEEKAKKSAASVLNRLGSAKSYWDLASKGESLLVLGKFQDAAEALQSARRCSDVNPSAVATTRRQLLRLIPSLGIESSLLSSWLPQWSVVVYSGHMPPKGGGDLSGSYEEVSQAVIRYMKERQIGLAYGSLAAGSDIICAQAALAQKSQLHVVLPFILDDFLQLSVLKDVSVEERGRFANVLSRADSLRVYSLERSNALRDAEVEERLQFSNRFMLGLGMIRAAELEASLHVLAVYNGEGVGSRSGTAQFVSDCQGIGLHVDRVACPWRSERPDEAMDVNSFEASTLAPVLFVISEVAGGQKKSRDGSTSGRSNRRPGGVTPCEEFSRVVQTKSEQLNLSAFVADSVQSALSVAQELRLAAEHRGEGVRLVCDFGPALDMGGKVQVSKLRRLLGADYGLTPPTGAIVLTESFAVEAKLSLGKGIQVLPLGRVASSGGGKGLRTAASVPMYYIK